MDMDPRTVLGYLKEIAQTRELTVEEKCLGRIAAKLQGKEIHEAAIAAKKAYDKSIIEHLTKECGYTAQEARAEIALEDFNSRIARGFGTSQRCRVGSIDQTTRYEQGHFSPVVTAGTPIFS
jgi:ribosomal protein L12E/L44/L45/RPP1/RPP2